MSAGGAEARRPTLDWNDREAVVDFFGRLRSALEDGHDVVEDMLLPPRQRDYGPALHAERYYDAWEQVSQLLTYAMPPGSAGGAPAHGG